MLSSLARTGWVVTLDLERPSFQDPVADTDRLRAALARATGVERVRLDLALMRDLPGILREADFSVACALFRDGEDLLVCGLRPSREAKRFLGLAVDLGTTRYVLRLLELASGRVLEEASQDNPQGGIGPDILTRIHYAGARGGRERLQRLIVEDMNARLAAMAEGHGLQGADVSHVVLAGNTAMTHFFLGLQTGWMIREPYTPAVNAPGRVSPEEVGLAVQPGAAVSCFPNAGSYFGGDVFAGILAAGLHRREEIAFLVDVGTNAEVVLGNKDWLIVCAGAAGPALEGGMSAIGKQAAPGVVDRVRIDQDSLELSLRTIGNQPPAGICGSGMIDLAAELFLAGLLDFRGKFVPEAKPDLFLEQDGIPHLRLVPAQDSATGEDLLIGQPEIDSLIRSKAAMFTILETVVRSVGLNFSAVSRFYVAGTFGSYIDPRSAISIGMLPDLPTEFYEPIGNSSLEGATEILRRPEGLEEVDAVRRRTTYLEMNVNQEFMNRFSAAKFLPHTDSGRFPSVERLLAGRAGRDRAASGGSQG